MEYNHNDRHPESSGDQSTSKTNPSSKKNTTPRNPQNPGASQGQSNASSKDTAKTKSNSTSNREELNPTQQTPENLQNKKTNKDQVTNKQEEMGFQGPDRKAPGGNKTDNTYTPNRRNAEVDDTDLMDDEAEEIVDETGDSPIYDNSEEDRDMDETSKRKNSENQTKY